MKFRFHAAQLFRLILLLHFPRQHDLHGGELKNTYWKFTNDSDYCRLNGINGGYFNFAAQQLYASTSLQVITTANIGGNLTCGGDLTIGEI